MGNKQISLEADSENLLKKSVQNSHIKIATDNAEINFKSTTTFYYYFFTGTFLHFRRIRHFLLFYTVHIKNLCKKITLTFFAH
jgi:hypothetical protein